MSRAAMEGGMDLVHLGITSSLHIHQSGALTFLGAGETLADWDDLCLLAVPA